MEQSLIEKASARLDLPLDTATGLPYLELTGHRALRMENYRGILSYGREEIHVDAGKWVLRICGENLEIRAMREGELLISGSISGLQLI